MIIYACVVDPSSWELAETGKAYVAYVKCYRAGYKQKFRSDLVSQCLPSGQGCLELVLIHLRTCFFHSVDNSELMR